MRFLIDRCAGRRLAEWLRAAGHDVVEARALGPDPGDDDLLRHAARDGRVLVTLDTDFGRLVFVQGLSQRGLIRLPDLPPAQRVALVEEVLARHGDALERGAIVTIRGRRMRITTPPASSNE